MIKLDDKGLVPAIVQDADTGRVLTLAYMNQESLERTRASGQVWFYSRSRQELWHKGETSGNYLNVRSISVDCDGDALLIAAEPTGPACHTGETSCFFEELPDETPEFERPPGDMLAELFQLIEQRKRDKPKGSYVSKLLKKGPRKIGKKVVEEAGEAVIAALDEGRERTVSEVADLWFHTLVLLASVDATPEQVFEELRGRQK